jgi:hypothetical protein
MKKISLLFVLMSLLMATLACNGGDNNSSTAMPSGTNLTPGVAATAVRPSTNVTPPTGAATDTGDEIDKLLDELNNALQNMDSLDDLK